MTGKVQRISRAEQWADRICAQVGKSVDAIIESGRLLQKAKDDLPHGEWGRLFDERLIPFSVGTAQRLMTIAEHPQLSNTAHVPLLPPSWGTLYELTKVEPQRLSAAFKDHLINPDMERKDVKALMAPARHERGDRTAMHVVVDEDGPEPARENEEPEPAQSRRKLGPPSNGLQFARIAIMKLEEIREDDTERAQAFVMVRRWIDAREA